MQWNSTEESVPRFNRNRVTLIATRIRISATLGAYTLVDGTAGLGRTVARRFTTWRKSLVTGLVIGAIITPSLLFLHERSLRVSQESQLHYLAATVESENAALKNTLQDLIAERVYFRSLLLDAGYQVKTPRELHIKVTTTGYSSSILETDDTPYTTAANTTTRPGIIALSRDLLKPYTPDAPFSFGDRVWLDGLGEFVVEDSMNRRWQRSADIWFPSRHQAIDFGRRELYLSKINRQRGLLGMNALDEAN